MIGSPSKPGPTKSRPPKPGLSKLVHYMNPNSTLNPYLNLSLFLSQISNPNPNSIPNLIS